MTLEEFIDEHYDLEEFINLLNSEYKVRFPFAILFARTKQLSIHEPLWARKKSLK